jgi:hypothetical protein
MSRRWCSPYYITFQGGNISAQRLDVAVNRMADKFKGGELWIANWDSGEDLKVIGLRLFPCGANNYLSAAN